MNDRQGAFLARPAFPLTGKPERVKLLRLHKAYTFNSPTLGRKMPGGWYSAQVMAEKFDPALMPPTSTADLTMPLGLTATTPNGDAAPEVYWINLDEDAQENTHNLDLDTPAYVYGWQRGTADNGIPVYYGFSVRGNFTDPLDLKADNTGNYAVKDDAHWQRFSRPEPYPDPLDKGGGPIDWDIDQRIKRASQFDTLSPAISTAQDLRIFSRHTILDAAGRLYQIKAEEMRTELTLPDFNYNINPVPINLSPGNPNAQPPTAKQHTMVWTLDIASNTYARALENMVEIEQLQVGSGPDFGKLQKRNVPLYVFGSLGDPGEWENLDLGTISGSGGLIPVTLYNDGGYDGNETTAPTYTYGTFINAITGVEIKNADGTSAVGQSPAWSRAIGSFNPATHGTVYIDATGNPVLWQVDETEKVCQE